VVDDGQLHARHRIGLLDPGSRRWHHLLFLVGRARTPGPPPAEETAVPVRSAVLPPLPAGDPR
jgi:hypothetical protein